MARAYAIISLVRGSQHGMIVNGFTPNESAEKTDARNEVGQVTDIWAYSISRKCSFSGVYDDATDLPHAGDKIKLTVWGVSRDWLVDDVSSPETNTGAVQVTFNVSQADDAEIHDYAETIASGGASETT